MIDLFNDPEIKKSLQKLPKLTEDERDKLRIILIQKSIEAVRSRIEQYDLKQIPQMQLASILVKAEQQIEDTLKITKIDHKNKYVEATIEDGNGNSQALQFPFTIAFSGDSEQVE